MQIITDPSHKELKAHGNDQFPLLVSYERLSSYESGSFLWHWHPEIELTLITSGQMLYQIGNQIFHLHEGDSLFGNTGALHAGSMYENQDCSYTSITFDPKLVYGYENSIIYIKYIEPILQNFSLTAICFDGSKNWHPQMRTLIETMILLYQQQEAAYELDLSVCLHQFFKLLYLYQSSMPEIIPADKRNYDRIRCILSYLESNYAYKITLEDIARQIHLCKSECCRLFKRYMKISLFDFILEYRIEKSLNHLTNSAASISEIAAAVGFHDSNYYSKVFHKSKGCSPSQYKKSR